MPDGSRAVASLTLSVQDYVQQGGFVALKRAFESGSQGSAAIVQEIGQARLRGRGGSGKLTAEKWQAVIDAVRLRGGPPYVVCNAYDADPKSMVAEILTTKQPFTVLEGVALASFAVGARESYIYLRSTNRAGHAAMIAALQESQDKGYLGNLAITIVGVDVGFMGGEESTMLEVIKGRRAMAVQRPPYPAQAGINELPTAIDNIETLTNVVGIMHKGAAAYVKTGSKTTTGTKIITVYDVDGKPISLEAPFGTPIAAILKECGVDLSPNRVKAIVVGGPEGGVLPVDAWNTPFDYETLQEAGTIVGSATIEVLPASTCMVEWARARMAYLTQENCGKCVPCRAGTKRVTGLLATIASDIGTQTEVDTLNDLADYIPRGSLCGFGRYATVPLKTAQRYFAEDFASHLKGTCPVGSCVPSRTHGFAKKGVL